MVICAPQRPHLALGPVARTRLLSYFFVLRSSKQHDIITFKTLKTTGESVLLSRIWPRKLEELKISDKVLFWKGVFATVIFTVAYTHSWRTWTKSYTCIFRRKSHQDCLCSWAPTCDIGRQLSCKNTPFGMIFWITRVRYIIAEYYWTCRPIRKWKLWFRRKPTSLMFHILDRYVENLSGLSCVKFNKMFKLQCINPASL